MTPWKHLTLFQQGPVTRLHRLVLWGCPAPSWIPTTGSLSASMPAYAKCHEGGCGTLGQRSSNRRRTGQKGFVRLSWCLVLSPLEGLYVYITQTFPRHSWPNVPDPREVWRNRTPGHCYRTACFPTWIPHPQLGGFEGGCVFQLVKKRSVPVLKGKPGAVFDRARGHWERQLPRKWFSRWVWHWVPACTLTPLTVFSLVYSPFSRDRFVDCFTGCCFDSR